MADQTIQTQTKATPVFVDAQGLEIIRKARIAAQQQFGLRPEMSTVVMALLMEGAKSPELNERIRQVVLTAFGKPGETATDPVTEVELSAQ